MVPISTALRGFSRKKVGCGQHLPFYVLTSLEGSLLTHQPVSC